MDTVEIQISTYLPDFSDAAKMVTEADISDGWLPYTYRIPTVYLPYTSCRRRRRRDRPNSRRSPNRPSRMFISRARNSVNSWTSLRTTHVGYGHSYITPTVHSHVCSDSPINPSTLQALLAYVQPSSAATSTRPSFAEQHRSSARLVRCSAISRRSCYPTATTPIRRTTWTLMRRRMSRFVRPGGRPGRACIVKQVVDFRTSPFWVVHARPSRIAFINV